MKYTRMLLLVMVAGFVTPAGALSLPINDPRGAPNCERTAALAYCRYAGPDPQIVLMTGLGNAMQSWQPSLLEALSRFADGVDFVGRNSVSVLRRRARLGRRDKAIPPYGASRHSTFSFG